MTPDTSETTRTIEPVIVMRLNPTRLDIIADDFAQEQELLAIADAVLKVVFEMRQGGIG